MSLQPGTHTLGPENARLTVRTGRAGAAAKAGHDLLIEVAAWSGVMEVGSTPEATSIRLSADGSSLRVLDGTGGMKSLDDDDKAGIKQTIDEDVLKRTAIEFSSTAVQARDDGARLTVQGELELAGRRNPIAFELTVSGDGHLTGGASVTQSGWGIKPYSTLFGALKVADEVQVEIDGELPAA
jgi:hypothetical protein